MQLNVEPSSSTLNGWGDQGDGTYRNPILWADYNNPWLMQQGEDFYLIAASHHFMGMPVLHSHDLVNWTLIAQVYDRLDYDDAYNHPGQAYQRGSWAPSMVFHDGRFCVFCMNSTDGLFFTSAPSPAGPWDPIQLIAKGYHWEDPFPFWDEDGSAYLFRSAFGGNAPLTLYRMNQAGTQLLDEGVVLKDTYPNAHNPLMIKREGTYYLFTCTSGTQVVFRSRHIYGPYERRILLEPGGVSSSPGGGGWVELPTGECWFMHHVGIPGHGRLPFLQPGGWKDGWPWIGVNISPGGTGQIAWHHAKPSVKQSSTLPERTIVDHFDSLTLKAHWRWNHNPDPGNYSLSERQSWLRLTASPLEKKPGEDGVHQPVEVDPDSILFARNTLVQLPIGKNSSAAALMDVCGMQNGQRAGICLFNKSYAWIGIVQENSARQIKAYTHEKIISSEPFLGQQIWLRAVCEDGVGSLFYSQDGRKFHQLGEKIPLKIQWFENHKYGIFTYTIESTGGYVDFDWFVIKTEED